MTNFFRFAAWSTLAIASLTLASSAIAQTTTVGSGTAPEPPPDVRTVTSLPVSFDPQGQGIRTVNADFTFDETLLTFSSCDTDPDSTVAGTFACSLSGTNTVVVSVINFTTDIPALTMANVNFETTAAFTTGSTGFGDGAGYGCFDAAATDVGCTSTLGSVSIVTTDPDISASPNPVMISASVGQATPVSQTVTITNSGTADGLSNITLGTPTDAAFTVSDVDCVGASLNQNGTCTFTVNLVDTTMATTFNGTVDITSNASSGTLTLPLEATITDVPTPGIMLDTTTLDFGTVDQGSAAPQQTVTVTSSGTADLVIGTVTGFDATFTSVSDTCSGQTLAPNATCAVTVAMATDTVGNPLTGTLFIPSNDANTPAEVTLTGVVQDAALTADTVNGATLAGMVMPGDMAEVVLTNTTGAPIAITSVVSDATNFSVADDCAASVPANDTCTVTVTYNGPDTVMGEELTIASATGDFVFRLTGGQMEPIGIPTLSQWSMMIMASLLALMAAFGLRRKES